MLHSVFRDSCLLLLIFLMTSASALYIPAVSSSFRRITDLGPVLEPRVRPSVKRSDRAFSTFTRFMARQSPRHRGDQAFVEKMFRLFDMDADDVIERDEFSAILGLLGIISHTFS